MELSPLHRDERFVIRKRSASFSTKTSQGFSYEEVVSIGDQALIRSISCDKYQEKNASGEITNSMQVRVSSFVSPGKNSLNKEYHSRPKFRSLPKNQEGTYYRKTKVPARKSLTFMEPASVGQSSREHNQGRQERSWIHNILLNIFYIWMCFKCIAWVTDGPVISGHDSVKSTITDLQTSVFGQKAAIDGISQVLQNFNEKKDSLVLVFAGCTGVGKSYTSSIIYQHFPWTENRHITFFGPDLEEKLMSLKYSKYNPNLVIVDSILTLNSVTVVGIINNVLKSLTNNIKVLIILNFQILNEEEGRNIRCDLQSLNADFKYIFFDNLKLDDIYQCFLAEVQRQNKVISEKTLLTLANEQLKTDSIAQSPLNCKNVYHEVLALPDAASLLA